MKKIITFLVVMFLFNINVEAASLCSYKEQSELNSKAANVKVSYEAVEEIKEVFGGILIDNYFNIEILNVTEEFYIIVKNDVTKEEKRIESSDANNGVISFKWTNLEQVTNFTFQIFTTSKTNCANEKIKTIYLATPRYNEFYQYAICGELTDFYLCEKYVTFNKIEEDDFFTKIESYKNKEVDNNGEDIKDKEEPTLTDKIFGFVDENKFYIIGGIIIITVGGIVIYRIRTKKQRELGL